jgi:two-component system sensor kinase ParS
VNQASKSSGFILSIEDEGPGVDSSLHDSLFERFISDYLNPLRKTGGSGLGLAIVQRVALAHHGEICLVPPLHSKEGAHFKLRISSL